MLNRLVICIDQTLEQNVTKLNNVHITASLIQRTDELLCVQSQSFHDLSEPT